MIGLAGGEFGAKALETEVVVAVRIAACVLGAGLGEISVNNVRMSSLWGGIVEFDLNLI